MYRLLWVRSVLISAVVLKGIESSASRLEPGGSHFSRTPTSRLGDVWYYFDQRLQNDLEHLVGARLYPCWEDPSPLPGFASSQFCETAHELFRQDEINPRFAPFTHSELDEHIAEIGDAAAQHLVPIAGMPVRIEVPSEPTVQVRLGGYNQLRVTFHSGATREKRPIDSTWFAPHRHGRTVFLEGQPIAQIFGDNHIVILADVLRNLPTPKAPLPSPSSIFAKIARMMSKKPRTPCVGQFSMFGERQRFAVVGPMSIREMLEAYGQTLPRDRRSFAITLNGAPSDEFAEARNKANIEITETE